MGNNSKVKTKGKGSVKLEHGRFKEVLFVPSLASNLLSVYQMTHTRSPKQVIFGPDLVDIIDISIGNIIVIERNSYGLGYHNRQLDSRNQSFPICNRNQISNTKGLDLIPYSGWLK